MKITGKNFSYVDESGSVCGLAIVHMRSKPPNEDGTIGFMVEPGTTEWLAWEAYFEQTDVDDMGIVHERFPKQLAFMRSRAASKKAYMVPDQLPWMFDPEFKPSQVKPKPQVVLSRDMTPEQRAVFVRKTLAEVRSPERERDYAKRTWVNAMYRLCPDRQAFIEILKQRPDLVEKATAAELGEDRPGLDRKQTYGMGWGTIRAEVEAIYWANYGQKEAAE